MAFVEDDARGLTDLPTPLDYAAPSQAVTRLGVGSIATSAGIGTAVGYAVTSIGEGGPCLVAIVGAAIGLVAAQWQTFELTRCLITGLTASLMMSVLSAIEVSRYGYATSAAALGLVAAFVVNSLAFIIPGTVTARLRRHSRRHL